jgi:hypothetical protein
MKAAGEEEFQNYDEQAISHYNICDCLDLYRKIQFTGLAESPAKRKLVASLKARIITLVMPGEGNFPTGKVPPRSS